MNREDRSSVALANQIVSGVLVARAVVGQTGQAHGIDLTADGTAMSVRIADQPPFDWFERIHVIHPADVRAEEDVLGLCKKLYTARSQGGTIPESTLKALGGSHLAGGKGRGLKHEQEEAVVSHLLAGPVTPQRPESAVATVETPPSVGAVQRSLFGDDGP